MTDDIFPAFDSSQSTNIRTLEAATPTPPNGQPSHTPDPNTIFPIHGLDTLTFIKPSLTNPNIIAGDFSYYSGQDFESRVTHHYPFNGDRLIIGKFCQIGAGVEFVMNGANHQMNSITTYPFFIFDGWNAPTPKPQDLPLKGDTVIGSDVWIGQNVTVLPGVHVGDGAIIGLNSTVTRDIPPYTIVAGNPARIIRKRFDDEMIALLERLKWWDKDIHEIKTLIPILTCPDILRAKHELKIYMGLQ
ncbi:MAG: CatB-related O-acetyltransferase [Synergistaceae bacterium]|nr:CatB-related O-acetyltransferase [Synergistaceae bacterium]MBQ3654173.1 CatB-related O-acetyltransferase [Synergistaceae bacterium]